MDPLSRIEDKIDKIVTTQGDQAVTLARQNATLEEHVRRTAAIEGVLQVHDDRIKPLESQSQMLMGAKVLLLALVPLLLEAVHLLWKH